MSSAAPSLDPYVRSIESHREDKDRFFASHPKSPLLPEQRSEFRGLAYFPVAREWVVSARLVRDPEAAGAVFETSKGALRETVRVGVLELQMGGETHRLVAFRSASSRGAAPGEESLFVPFRDATSGVESYGAGRYLDLPAPQDAAGVALDFNLAYSPYCAYNQAYSCSLAPRENRLTMAVRAGERLRATR